MARTPEDRMAKRYMIICCYGIIILFSANQRIGLRHGKDIIFNTDRNLLTAISVSLNSSLRQSIRRAAVGEAHLLDKIGIAEYQREIEKRVITTTQKAKDLIEYESGITSSLSDEEIRNLIAEIVKEMKIRKVRHDFIILICLFLFNIFTTVLLKRSTSSKNFKVLYFSYHAILASLV